MANQKSQRNFCPARPHLDTPKDGCSTVWTEAIVKLPFCIVEEGIVLQLTRGDLNLGILKVEFMLKAEPVRVDSIGND